MSQQISPEVISSAGDYFSNQNISLSWTLGEPVISTLEADYILTQGFHQDLYIITAVDEVEITGLDIKIYPNPTPNEVNIVWTPFNNHQNQKVIIQLFDFNGRLILQEESKTDHLSAKINLLSFERAQYLLKIIYNEQIKTFKIIKS
jgi:hypothetical protein